MTAVLPDTGTIEDLEFERVVPCEAAQPCDAPGAWLWRLDCGCRGVFAYCQRHHKRALWVIRVFPKRGGICPVCERTVHGIVLGPIR